MTADDREAFGRILTALNTDYARFRAKREKAERKAANLRRLEIDATFKANAVHKLLEETRP